MMDGRLYTGRRVCVILTGPQAFSLERWAHLYVDCVSINKFGMTITVYQQVITGPGCL